MYVLFSLVVAVLMIASCAPKSLCGNGVCDAAREETVGTCPADCKEQAQPQPAAKEIVASVSPASLNAKVGDEITLEVKIDDVKDLFGFQFDMGYNQDVLEFQQAKQGTLLNNNGKENTFCVDHRQMPNLIKNLVCSRFGDVGISGSGVMETVIFKAKAAGTSDITISNLKLADSKATLMQSKAVNGKVVVS
jgi:hypothetical protein